MQQRPSKRKRATSTTTTTTEAATSSKFAKYRNRAQDYKHKWSVFKTQATKREIERRLDFEQYVALIQMPCTYCGKGAGRDPSNTKFVGIDRIDSDMRVYCLSNCVPSCATCNFMKGAMSHGHFLSQVRAIAKWRTGVQF